MDKSLVLFIIMEFFSAVSGPNVIPILLKFELKLIKVSKTPVVWGLSAYNVNPSIRVKRTWTPSELIQISTEWLLEPMSQVTTERAQEPNNYFIQVECGAFFPIHQLHNYEEHSIASSVQKRSTSNSTFRSYLSSNFEYSSQAPTFCGIKERLLSIGEVEVIFFLWEKTAVFDWN